MTDRKVLIITGMHRSGTSLLTQWLYRCGLHVGDQFMGAGLGNEEGHFEDLDFYRYHKNVLKDHRLKDDGLIHTTFNTLSDGQLYEMRQLLEKKNKQLQWAWKEPRTCLFLPHYRQLLPDARYLVILRDYRSVVSSLISRIYKKTERKYAYKRGIPKFIWLYIKRPFRKKILLKRHSEDFLNVWITYNEAILAHLQQLEREQYLVIDHADLSANNMDVFEHLSARWNFDLRYYSYDKVYKEKLQHDVLDIERYIRNKSLLTKASALCEQLKSRISHN